MPLLKKLHSVHIFTDVGVKCHMLVQLHNTSLNIISPRVCSVILLLLSKDEFSYVVYNFGNNLIKYKSVFVSIHFIAPLLAAASNHKTGLEQACEGFKG